MDVRKREVPVVKKAVPAKKVVPASEVKKNESAPIPTPEVKKDIPAGTPEVKPEKVKKEKAPKEPKPERELGATGYVITLLVQHKYTDEEIIAMTKAKYPDRSEKQIKVYISCQRGDINSGRKMKWQKVAGKVIVPLVKNEKGELIAKAELPKPAKKAAVKKEKPLLKNILDGDETDEEGDAMPETHNSNK